VVISNIANDNQQTQNQQAHELINEEEVDVLVVVSVDQNEASEIVEIANEAEIKVIAYDRLIRNCLLDYYVTTNSVSVGEMQASYMASLVPKGNYALLNGDKKDNNSMMLFLGQMNTLQEKVESGDIRIIYSEFTDSWSRDEAYIKAQDILDLRDSVDVIIVGSDELAYGVNRALDETGLLGKVKVISQDADLKIVQSIVQGNQTATIYKPLKQMGHKTAELAIAIANGDEVDKNYTTVSNGKRLVPSYLSEPTIVDINSVSSTVIAEGYLKSEEIYQ
jgi:D-xylose transport system substrate-binding protein